MSIRVAVADSTIVDGGDDEINVKNIVNRIQTTGSNNDDHQLNSDNNNYESETDEADENELIDEIFRIRLKFFKKLKNNSLYVNTFDKEPWKLISNLADGILKTELRELITIIEKQELELIDGLLNMELN